MSSFERIKNLLGRINQDNIHFKNHFYDKVIERPISEDLVREYLKKTERLLRAEEQQSYDPDEKKI